MSNPLVIVCGETGVGKDYLVDDAIIGFSGQVRRMNWGTAFSEIAQVDRDNIEMLPGENQTEAVQKKVVAQALRILPAVITSHPIKTINGVDFVNTSIERQLSARYYALVTAQPECIAERILKRNAETARQTKERSIDEIAHSQGRKVELIVDLAFAVGAQVVYLSNDTQEQAENAVCNLRKLIKNIVS